MYKHHTEFKQVMGDRAKEKLGAPVVGLALLLTSYFYTLPLGRYDIAGFSTDYRIYDFAFIIFTAMFGLRRWGRIVNQIKIGPPYFRWLAYLVVLVWASLMITLVLGGLSALLPAVIRAFRFTAYLVTALLVFAFVDTPRRHLFVTKVLFANIALQAFLAFAQAMKWLPSFWPPYWLALYGDRPVGTLSPHHKHIGVVMMLGVGLALAFWQRTRSLLKRTGLLVLIALMIMVPIFGGTRTAWFGFLAMLLMGLYVFKGRGLFSVILLGALLGTAVFWPDTSLGNLLTDQLNTRLIARADRLGLESIYGERTEIYFELMPEAIANHPWVLLIGSGFQNISAVMRATGAHNNYLQALFELGMAGFLVYLLFLRTIWLTLRRVARLAQDRFQRALANQGLITFGGLLVTMMVGETMWAQYNQFTLTGQIMAFLGLATVPLLWSSQQQETRVESNG